MSIFQPYAVFTTGILAIFVVVLVGTTTAFGDDRGRGHRPPEEAFSACDSKSEGDACSVETPHGALDGTCRMPPRGEDRLVCVPADNPRGRDR